MKTCASYILNTRRLEKIYKLRKHPDNPRVIKDNSSFGEWDWDDLANAWDVDKLNEWALDMPPMFDEFKEEKEETKKCECCGK